MIRGHAEELRRTKNAPIYITHELLDILIWRNLSFPKELIAFGQLDRNKAIQINS
jgi:hypothetical protein